MIGEVIFVLLTLVTKYYLYNTCTCKHLGIIFLKILVILNVINPLCECVYTFYTFDIFHSHHIVYLIQEMFICFSIFLMPL